MQLPQDIEPFLPGNLAAGRVWGWSLLAAGVLCGGVAFWLHTQPAMLPWPTLGAWAAGIILFIAGAWLMPAGRQREAEDRATVPQHTEEWYTKPWQRWEVFAVGALTLLALLLRVLGLGDVPGNVSGDEGEMGMWARKVLAGEVHDPFATGWLSHPNMWFFLQALSLKLAGNTIGGLRVASALMGTAAIPMFYLFVRPLYGRSTALLAIVLLTTFHFHLHYSRYALNNIADPLMGLIIFTAFLHGLRARLPFSFALAGVALGVALHFYMGTRLFLVLMGVVGLHQLVFHHRRVFGLLGQLMLVPVGFVLGGGPLLHYFITNPEAFSARFKSVGIFYSEWFTEKRVAGMSEVQIWLDQFYHAFGSYLFIPDQSSHYDPGIAFLNPVSGVLFLFGVALVVVRWRRVDSVLLLAWLVLATFFGGVLLANTPESGRYVTTAPLLCLFVALAVAQVGHVVKWVGKLPQHAGQMFGALIVVGLALWNVHFYFLEFGPRENFSWTEPGNQIGAYLAAEDTPDEPIYVYFFGAPRLYLRYGSIRFLAPEVQGTDVAGPLSSPDNLPPLPDGHRPIFVFYPPHREDELTVVRERYPYGTLYKFPWRSREGLLFRSYEPDMDTLEELEK